MIVNNGAMVRSKEGHTHVRHLLPLATARRVLQSTEPWREGAAVVFRPPAGQPDGAGKDRLGGPTRGGYYKRKPPVHGESHPLEACLNEEPYPGDVYRSRCAHASSRKDASQRAFASDYSLAVTVYGDKDFAMIDVIHPSVSKAPPWPNGQASAAIPRRKSWPLGITITTWKCYPLRVSPWLWRTECRN